jgi:hypothetical protein
MLKGYIMKKSIIGLLFFSFMLQGFIIPSWYPNDNSTQIISYGDGITIDEAKKNALESIKEKLVEKNSLDYLETISVDDLVITKQEILENRYFLQVSYENLSTLEKIKNLLKKQVFKLKDETNNYLLQTPLLEDINNSFGYYADITLDDNFTNFLQIADKKIVLKQDDYKLFLHNFRDLNISLDVEQNLTKDSLYFIKIDTNIEGYLSLVQISNEYDVVVLVENKKLNNSDMIYPNFKQSDGLMAILDENQDEREFTTIAFICEEKKDLKGFNNIYSDKLVFGRLGKLIEVIGDCKYSSIISSIKSEK